MFNIPQKKISPKLTMRNARVFELRQLGISYQGIAENPEIIEMSGGYLLTRERIRQLVNKVAKEQKSTE